MRAPFAAPSCPMPMRGARVGLSRLAGRPRQHNGLLERGVGERVVEEVKERGV